MTVEELDIVISAQNREFNRAIDDVIGRLDGLEEQSRRTGGSIEGIFSNLAGKLAALGIGKIISDSIMGGGELEQQLGGVEVVFKSHADSMKEAAVSAAENMGLSESAYLASANKMGALFKGSGFDIAYAADMSQQAIMLLVAIMSRPTFTTNLWNYRTTEEVYYEQNRLEEKAHKPQVVGIRGGAGVGTYPGIRRR